MMRYGAERTALIAALALGTSLLVTHVAIADTHGNTDHFEGTLDSNPSNSPKQTTGNWWSGSNQDVTQRYGCTLALYGEPDSAPAWCPYPYNGGWHQGIDVGISQPTTLYSQVDGVVAEFASSCLQLGCALGYLAIRTETGNILYLLHGSPNSPFANIGYPVHVGDSIYTTGANGAYSSGYHLHLEVHKSVVGQLSVPTGPGDDINPEPWLWPVDDSLTTHRVSGDFNGDGYEDTAVFYRGGDGGTVIWVFLGQAGGSFQLPMQSWWNQPPTQLNWYHSKLVAGDFEGTGRDDIAILYDYSDASCASRSGLLLLHSTGTSFTWDGTSFWGGGGSQFCGNLSWANSQVVAGCFNAGRLGCTQARIALLYDYSNPSCWQNAAVLVFPTYGSSGTWTQWWPAAGTQCSNFDWSRSKLTVGDFSGDGLSDIAVLYDYSSPGCSPDAAIRVFVSTGSSFNLTNWYGGQGSPYCGNLTWSRSKIVGGDFINGTYDSIALLYDYSTAQCPANAVVFGFASTGSTLTSDFTHPWWGAYGNCNSFNWNRAKLAAAKYAGTAVRSYFAVFYDYSGTGCPFHSAWLVFPPTGTGLGNFADWWDLGCGMFDWSASKPL